MTDLAYLNSTNNGWKEKTSEWINENKNSISCYYMMLFPTIRFQSLFVLYDSDDWCMRMLLMLPHLRFQLNWMAVVLPLPHCLQHKQKNKKHNIHINVTNRFLCVFPRCGYIFSVNIYKIFGFRCNWIQLNPLHSKS